MQVECCFNATAYFHIFDINGKNYTITNINKKYVFFIILLKIVILKFFTKKYRIIYIYNQLKIYVTYISFYSINLFIYKYSTCTPTCNFLQGSYLSSLHISRSTTNKILRMKFLETRTVQ